MNPAFSALAAALATHVPSDDKEAQDAGRIREFVASHEHPFDRAIVAGHLTGSALVMSGDGAKVLLLHHRKLNLWLQPGGHGDPGEMDGALVAAREAREETGVTARLHETAPRPFDVDIHRIPARGAEPAHDHLDLRYLFVADSAAPISAQVAETRDVRWFGTDEALGMALDPGLLRMIRKGRATLVPGLA